MNKLLRKVVYFFTAISFLCFPFSLHAMPASDVEDLAKIFPHKITMDIGGMKRVLTRERHIPKGLQPPKSSESPLEYDSWKREQGRTLTRGQPLTFSRQERSWYLGAEKASPLIASPFSEGSIFGWTRDFELLINFDNSGHIGLRNGDYMLCAGTAHFDEHGLICHITNDAGHIFPELFQLQQMVDDLRRLGAVASNLKVSDYAGNSWSLGEFLVRKIAINLQSLQKVEADPRLDQKYSSYILASAVLLSERPQSLVSKVFEILFHHRLEVYVVSKFPPPYEFLVVGSEERELSTNEGEIVSNKRQRLERKRPHGCLYEQVLEVAQDYNEILRLMDVHRSNLLRGKHTKVEEGEATKKSRENLRRKFEERRYPPLFDQLVPEAAYIGTMVDSIMKSNALVE